jgi:hypothetical protein
MSITRHPRKGQSPCLVWSAVVLAGMAIISNSLLAQAIPADRLGQWSRSGVFFGEARGIPKRTTVFCNVRIKIPGSSLLAKGDGASDDTAAIQAAIDACPPGQVVFIPQGNYRISKSLVIGRGIIVRGEAPGKTRIRQHAPVHIFVIQGAGTSFWYATVGDHPETGLVQSLESGFSRGSDKIVIKDASEFNAGNVVLIDQLNDPSLVSPRGEGGLCAWCGLGAASDHVPDGSRAMAETLVIKKKNGNSLTLSRPLNYAYQSRFQPRMVLLSRGPVVNAGIEDMSIESAEGNREGSGILMTYCVHCWAKNVEGDNIAQKHVDIEWGAYGNEVRDSIFHRTPRFDADHGYGVNIHNFATDNLIENNAFDDLHTGVIIGSAGGSGNVVAYNYVGKTRHWQDNWFLYQLGTHGAHTYMNLFEGNVCGKVGLDSYWGSGSHTVFFRNLITRVNGDVPVTSDLSAVNIEAFNYWMTFVGNIVGSFGCRGPVEQVPYRNAHNNPVLWKIGYLGAATGNPSDPKVAETLLKTGNWECVTGTVQWTSPDRTLPDSLYLAAKPVWFGDLPWPPFAPDRSDFRPKHQNAIPAQSRCICKKK